MLRAIRIVSALLGAGLVVSVLSGGMSVRLFWVPDLLLSAGLVAAALCPPQLARPALLAANAYATGVFTVAAARYVIEDGRINPGLVFYVAMTLLFTILLLIDLRRRARTD